MPSALSSPFFLQLPLAFVLYLEDLSAGASAGQTTQSLRQPYAQNAVTSVVHSADFVLQIVVAAYWTTALTGRQTLASPQILSIGYSLTFSAGVVVGGLGSPSINEMFENYGPHQVESAFKVCYIIRVQQTFLPWLISPGGIRSTNLMGNRKWTVQDFDPTFLLRHISEPAPRVLDSNVWCHISGFWNNHRHFAVV